LQRIKAEKQALIAAKTIKREKYLPPIEKKDLPFELPKDWVWCRLGEVAHQCLGKMLDKSKNKGIPTLYLRNTNVRWFEFELNDVNLMKFEPSELERFSIKKGDILICEGGEPGRAAIWEQEDLGYKFQKALHRVRFYDGVDSKYFVYYLYFIAKRKILDKLFTGMTIKHLTGQSLKILPIPLPPLSEQKRIVEKVEKLLQYCEALEGEIENSVGNAEVLMQSVLQEAFG
jgi:type I restriction enzyme S subunit